MVRLVAVHPLGGHAVEEVTEANLGNGTVAATGATTLQEVQCAGHELLRREGLQGARGDGHVALHSLRRCKCKAGSAVALILHGCDDVLLSLVPGLGQLLDAGGGADWTSAPAT